MQGIFLSNPFLRTFHKFWFKVGTGPKYDSIGPVCALIIKTDFCRRFSTFESEVKISHCNYVNSVNRKLLSSSNMKILDCQHAQNVNCNLWIRTKSTQIDHTTHTVNDPESGTIDEPHKDSKVDSASIYSKFYEEDKNLPQNYKELLVHVTSIRLDSVIKAVLNMSRSEFEEIFYGSRVRRNAEKALKKSKKINEGDFIDLVLSESEGIRNIKRIRVLHIADVKSKKGRHKVYVRAWRGGFNEDIVN